MEASVDQRLGSEFYLSLHDGDSSSETLLVLNSIRKHALCESIAGETRVIDSHAYSNPCDILKWQVNRDLFI